MPSRSAAASLLIVSGVLSNPSFGQEIYLEVGNAVQVYDLPTGTLKRTVPIAQGSNLWGMVYVNGRLLAIDEQGGLPADLVEIHPATGATTLIGKTGQVWNLVGQDYDPVSKTLYAVYGDELFSIDITTGLASPLGQIQGLPTFEHLSLAIDQSGTAYAIGWLDHSLYQVDLVGLAATKLGTIQLGTLGSDFQDLAFDASGQLWGVWQGLPAVGVYKIDIASATATHSFYAFGSRALAIGPATPETPYCAGKTNSLGCDPVLTSSGLASATADFGYEVTASQVHNHTNGRLIYSLAGAASTPFAGGTLCVASPWKGTSVVSSGGNPKPAQDCTGSWVADMNAELAAKPGPQPGDTIYCQWIGRDRGFAPPDNYASSSALEFTLLP